MAIEKNKPLTLSANAKVNLHLHIGPQRADGYHALQTVFQEIALSDDLTFRRTPGPLRLTIRPSGLPTDHRNLVFRALALLKNALQTPDGMHVHLEKRIPHGAGLGGGSSDAAAALRGGWMLWTRNPSRGTKPSYYDIPVLRKCAAQLGADVSFFLRGGRAWAEGAGEKCAPLPSGPRRWLVLVYPRVHVSTAKAYDLLDRSRRGLSLPLPAGRNLSYPFNSFEAPILAAFPAIQKAFDGLVEQGCRNVMLSGSGSTVFGCVDSEEAGWRIKRRLSRRPWTVFVCHTV